MEEENHGFEKMSRLVGRKNLRPEKKRELKDIIIKGLMKFCIPFPPEALRCPKP